MKLLLLLSLSIFICKSAFSQDHYVYKVDSIVWPELKAKNHQEYQYLSDNICVKLEQFAQLYTRKVDCGPPAHISSIEIDKPDLYYSIKKLSKYYFKGLKKGLLNKDDAEKELESILLKCMAIHSQKTISLEQELKIANNPEEILAVFQKIVIK